MSYDLICALPLCFDAAGVTARATATRLGSRCYAQRVTKLIRRSKLIGVAAGTIAMLVATAAIAQPADPPADPPADAPDDSKLAPDDDPPEVPAEPPDPPDDMDDMDDMGDMGDDPDSDESSSLTVHIVSTRNTYETMRFDVFDATTEEVVASGRGADETAGKPAPTFDLPPGIYKIVKAGEPFSTLVDFAKVSVDGPTDFFIVIDPQSRAFRGSGIVTGDLPSGRTVAGVRLALNVGGTVALNQQENIVGTTNGLNVLVGLFGNFSLVLNRGDHFLKVDSQLSLTIRDPETADAFSTMDYFKGSALYAFNIKNKFVGPYGRVGFATKVFPGYLYLEENELATGVVNVNRLDGTVDTFVFGGAANADDLRIEVAKAFAPLILQEEVGVNLKAADINLKLLELSVATRLGFGLRQGITNGLLVVDGSEDGTPVNLFEIDDYFTLGPVAGATATITFARWLFGSGEVGLMVPVKDTDAAGDSFGERLLIDLSATGGLKFPSLSFFYGSIDYTLRLQREGYLTTDTQFAHSIMARANLQLF